MNHIPRISIPNCGTIELTTNSNPCIICGKARIITKTYTEKTDNGTLTHVITSCPDPECQKKVDKILANEKAGRDDMKKKSVEREKERLERAQQSRLNNKKGDKNQDSNNSY